MKVVSEVVILIDKSGSMQGSETRVVKGYNELLREQKAETGTMLLTTVLFDVEAVMVHNCVEIQEAQELRLIDYIPSGSTALIDAIGDAVTAIKQRNLSTSGLFVVFTDGMENSSTRHTYGSVALLLNWLKANEWDIRFIGADLANFADAERIGISRDKSMSIAKENLFPAMKDISGEIRAMRKSKSYGG